MTNSTYEEVITEQNKPIKLQAIGELFINWQKLNRESITLQEQIHALIAKQAEKYPDIKVHNEIVQLQHTWSEMQLQASQIYSKLMINTSEFL